MSSSTSAKVTRLNLLGRRLYSLRDSFAGLWSISVLVTLIVWTDLLTVRPEARVWRVALKADCRLILEVVRIWPISVSVTLIVGTELLFARRVWRVPLKVDCKLLLLVISPCLVACFVALLMRSPLYRVARSSAWGFVSGLAELVSQVLTRTWHGTYT